MATVADGGVAVGRLPFTVDAVPVDPRSPALYINRELSWLEFNRRVLHEARDPRTPLLERVKFLSIFASNLDEFFQVRVAGLRQQVAAHLSELTSDGMSPDDQLRAIAPVVRELVREHGACLTQEVMPALAERGIELIGTQAQLSGEDAAWLDHYFTANVFPVLTPLAVDPAHPFPYISNLSLSLAVILRGDSGEERFARVKVPKILPRWVPLPGTHRYAPLDLVIATHLEALFPGVEILGSYPFRITRNTDLEIDPDEADDLLALIQEEVRNRRFAEVVRLEVHAGMPESLRQLLLAELNADQETDGLPLVPEDVYAVEGLLDATDLMAIAGLEIPDLRDPSFLPAASARLAGAAGGGRNIFDVIREGDVFVHHPYESFSASVERFIQTATEDPDVLAIKMTLYRTGGDSHIARMLASAAERGKQVAVLIELQARFDEENNIRWAQRFEDVGVHVSYGVAGLKTHAKVILVVRREGDQIRRYVHIGTGNYAPRTARLYTDFGLFTADADLGADLSDLFNVLTGFASPQGYRKLVVAPTGMRKRLVDLIRREIAHAGAGRPARIFAKMNALVDAEIIALLYEASRAGVSVDLLVRGISCLRPGIPGVSDRIRVVSVVGRFLEHSRAWYFHNAGDAEVHISSADWMPRNLDRRIETAVPLEPPSHRETVLRLLELMWSDNRQAWDLAADGTWTQRMPREGEREIATHRDMVEWYKRGSSE
ncbi:MAG TPA: polyphosphate kinase 1 [Gemmatimonadales bacterium]|jgi:polyphosphate kinase|nr:polyphosphate kinase 1 [Gemmatimonadales bacterium]